jgi:hypothetical protein
MMVVSASATVFGQSRPTQTPLLAILDQFTASDVPAFGPAEQEVPARKWEGTIPANLPGHGLAQHPMLYLGEGYNKMFLINQGKIIWTFSTGRGNEYDDIWLMTNGHILFSRMQYVAEITLINTQTCTRLANGNTVICSRGGNSKGPQVIEVTPAKKVVWVLQDWANLGPATAVQMLDDPGIPENPGESEH